MLCEVSLWGNFWSTWAFMTILGLCGISLMSGILFRLYYVNPTYEKWRRKCNPAYPTPVMVKEEIIQMCKGMATATLCPSLSLFLTKHGYSKAYCGVGDHGWTYLIVSFFVTSIVADFCEFYYHRMGHVYKGFWRHHKSHHKFYNPSPFAVIADEYLDQFMRSSLLLLLPMIFHLNMDMLFVQYAVVFYAYGVYLHYGHETEWPDAHHPILNTSFQHYCHHARSSMGKPYHTGFFLKAWDQMFGSTWPDDKCFCTKCEIRKGGRTLKEWERVRKTIPDYRILLQPSFWLSEQPSSKTRE